MSFVFVFFLLLCFCFVRTKQKCHPASFLVRTSLHVPTIIICIVSFILHWFRQQQQQQCRGGGVVRRATTTTASTRRSTTQLQKQQQQQQQEEEGRGGGGHEQGGGGGYTMLIQDIHIGLCGLYTAIGISEGITQIIKLHVLRHRPNFYQLCGFHRTKLRCMNEPNMILESILSFPSGHSSLSCSSMTFLILYILTLVERTKDGKKHNNNNNNNKRKIGSRNRRQQQQQRQRNYLSFVIILVPLFWTLYVATSRLIDHWHHPSDIIAGLLLGILSANISYRFWCS